MMEYILNVKTTTDNLAAIGEPVKERYQIFKSWEVWDMNTIL